MLSVVWFGARTPHAGVQYLMGWARGRAKRDGRYMAEALAVYMAETAAANWPLFLYTLAVRRIRCYCCSFGGDGVARSTSTDRHRHCNSWGSSRRQTGESLRLSILILASLLVEALAALPRAAWPVMCFRRCKMWICACPQNLCELISSAGLANACLACARGLGPGSTGCACRPAINSIDTHVTRPDITTEPSPDFRPCKQSLQSCLPWVRVTSVRHAWCIKPPDETRPQPALRSPLPIIIIAHHHRTIPHARRPHVRENRPESNFSPFHVEIIYLDFVGSVCRTILHHAHDVVHHSSATINLDEHPNRPLSPPSS